MTEVDHRPLRPHTDAIAEPLDESLLLVHLGHGTTFRMNRTARLIWELVGAGLTREEVTLEMQTRFSLSPEQARHDVGCLLAALLRYQLMEPVPEPACAE